MCILSDDGSDPSDIGPGGGEPGGSEASGSSGGSGTSGISGGNRSGGPTRKRGMNTTLLLIICEL